MYIARLPGRGRTFRYMIRQSYADGACYRSRNLFDLGDNPSRFIIYPGGNSFYIDLALEEAIAAKGVPVSQDDLEPLFMPFITPHIRRVIAGFDKRSSNGNSDGTCQPADAHHHFDRYRLHFLKLGQVDYGRMACMPDRFYSVLQHKSRDEIENDFMTAEAILKPKELSLYTFQVFNLQRFFNGHIARSHPQGLDQVRMDRFFIQALCQLNQDESFWMGSEDESGLRQHLVRYAVMYFDNVFPSHQPLRDFLRDFIHRHQNHQPPQSVRISLTESARLLEVSEKELGKMDCRTLTRRYRQQALKHHPDKGGNQDTFVKLSAAYHKLLKRKSRL